jgi:glutaredoxin
MNLINRSVIRIKIKTKHMYLIGAVVAIAAITGVFVFYNQLFVPNDKYDNFAKCLTEKGAILYASKYCPHCKNQKDMFGSSVRFLNMIDCADNEQKCTNDGITGVPTWIINGQRYTGEKQLDVLSSLSGCPLA